MWLSSKMRPAPATADADLGVTTIAGERVGVVTRGEVRDLPVYGPGGYLWAPGSGAAVLVVKGGPGGEEQCVAGMRPLKAPRDIRPGEVYLYGPGGSAVYLRQDGGVEIQGRYVNIKGGEVAVSGSLTVDGVPYKPCNC
ncbi:hypothetical protein [uncultured Oscillibacter sp.]|uniref:hypothetical protein n=1 Tax=uncultured Oscillibacter sp. TaxID=876091 RepID=UPI0025DC635C|nr:hypothetical protein [uncultured Oscillibacter sp.]